jgi:hypothetical protein
VRRGAHDGRLMLVPLEQPDAPCDWSHPHALPPPAMVLRFRRRDVRHATALLRRRFAASAAAADDDDENSAARTRAPRVPVMKACARVLWLVGMQVSTHPLDAMGIGRRRLR